jgi:hypothetical protein
MITSSNQAVWCVAGIDSPGSSQAISPTNAARQLSRQLAASAWRGSAWLHEDWSICSRDSQGRSRRPVTFASQQRIPWHFSLSHGDTFAAVACASTRRIGIDVVDRYLGRPTSLHWAMTPAELEWLAQSGPSAAPFNQMTRTLMLWAGKEAAFKASRARKFQPQCIEIIALDHQPRTRVGTVDLLIHWDLLTNCIIARASHPRVTWCRKFVTNCGY